ncbi:Uncharacterised protein [Corynebacterium kutscheri]|uniref:ABC transporter domain-containing protein n=2 Tax=Corynebacterium kutscheri TaxID=35755 RepID=A0A0F6TE92_9CORY|nr:hypothetical protein UL82_08700 [Corynebacterium kutscheri]VEH04442.1 Uncharacterised protein [Corynebacterium kutscheri]VEH10225.1 Uncharacterised protein [Corynebacterium kutscheri]VEH80307.1 Uncharacterised protein [Corynebacterium kutscheri]
MHDVHYQLFDVKRQHVAISAALISNREIFIFDEPTSATLERMLRFFGRKGSLAVFPAYTCYHIKASNY